jgi:hypothetical protein
MDTLFAAGATILAYSAFASVPPKPTCPPSQPCFGGDTSAGIRVFAGAGALFVAGTYAVSAVTGFTGTARCRQLEEQKAK